MKPAGLAYGNLYDTREPSVMSADLTHDGFLGNQAACTGDQDGDGRLLGDQTWHRLGDHGGDDEGFEDCEEGPSAGDGFTRVWDDGDGDGESYTLTTEEGDYSDSGGEEDVDSMVAFLNKAADEYIDLETVISVARSLGFSKNAAIDFIEYLEFHGGLYVSEDRKKCAKRVSAQMHVDNG